MSPKAFTRDEKERLFQAQSYLVNHLDQKLTVRGLARVAAMGEQRFLYGFRLYFGCTPGAYIKEARMRTAMVLLKHTDMPLKEIAALCGFTHYKNFLTAFRLYHDVRPGAIRA